MSMKKSRNMPKTKRRKQKAAHYPKLLVLGGFMSLVAVFLGVKASQEEPQSPFAHDPNQLAEVQLDQALEARWPVLAFFHSNNCVQCLIMVDLVAEVYPEFQERVVLVDVDVYDDLNRPLLGRVRLQYIPTLIFYDRTGKTTSHVGVMEASDLMANLKDLAGGD
jgi:thiol:disulfide interchange protein